MLHHWIGWDDALGVNKSQSHRLIVSHHSCPHPHHNHYHHRHRGPKSSADNQSSLASAARATISRPSGQVAQNCAAPDVEVSSTFLPLRFFVRIVLSRHMILACRCCCCYCCCCFFLLLLFFFVVVKIEDCCPKFRQLRRQEC